MIPVIDFDIYASLILPLNHRIQETLLYVRATLYSIKRLYTVFTLYKAGSTYDFYDSGTPYPLGFRVRTIYGVYESLIDGNTGNPTTDTTKWEKILDSFIGIDEQVNFNSNKIVYEFALNRWFGTAFVQYANAAYTPLSDIYIVTGILVYTSFIVGETIGSYVGESASTGYVGETATFTSSSTYIFTIYVPLSVYNSLGATDTIRDKSFRFFADRLLPAGCTYVITTY